MNDYTKGKGIEEAQERKAGFIRVAQDRKERSIAFFNATNSAIAMYQALKSTEDPHEFILRERAWFLSEFERYNSGDLDQTPF